MTTAVGALSTIATVAAFLVSHRAAIKKEFDMIRQPIADFVAAVQAFEQAVSARLVQPAPLTPEETATLSAAQAQVVAATAAVNTPVQP
jgi:F0F1-type ATP synthase delta subunit